tara:strand:- start:9 stop:263 length:255 start_codon:yes stop_codon:yes gene_type:complete
MNQDCVECKRSTAFGSGLFVNRIPADDNEGNVGYMCPECQMIECEECNQKVLDDYEIIDGVFVCLDCIDKTWENNNPDGRKWGN